MPRSISPRAAALFALACAGAAVAQPRSPAFVVAETGRDYGSLQAAVDAIGDGRGTITIAPGRYSQCAVQQAGSIAFVASAPGETVLSGKVCEGKAALVLRGRGAEVRGLIFERYAVGDGNAAGIRLERGDLAVSQSWFRDSQQGILSANDPNGSITVDKSTFTRLGTCENSAGCAHGIYVGHYRSLQITRSRFEEGTGGHYVKSRSAHVEITSSSFDDSKGDGTNYMIDLPAGSTGQITNNWFVQGPDKDNHSTFIAIAAESHDNPADGLLIAGNDVRLAPGVDWSTAFVADWSGDRVQLGANRLGEGIRAFERR